VDLRTLNHLKGLEFKCVIVPGLNEGTLPHVNSIEQMIMNLEEERRLMYLAMTRAMERRIITYRKRQVGQPITLASGLLKEFGERHIGNESLIRIEQRIIAEPLIQGSGLLPYRILQLWGIDFADDFRSEPSVWGERNPQSHASQFQKLGSASLGVFRLNINSLIRNRKLGSRVADMLFRGLWRPSRLGLISGRYFS
jgi:hypothetical protein